LSSSPSPHSSSIETCLDTCLHSLLHSATPDRIFQSLCAICVARNARIVPPFGGTIINTGHTSAVAAVECRGAWTSFEGIGPRKDGERDVTSIYSNVTLYASSTYRGQNVEDCLWFPAGTPQEKIKEAQSLIRQFPQAASAQLQQQCFARGITPPWSDDGNEQSQPPLFVNLPAMPFSGNGEYLQVNHAGRSYSIPDEMPRVNVFKQGSLYGPQVCPLLNICYRLIALCKQTFLLAVVRGTEASHCGSTPHHVVPTMILSLHIGLDFR